MNEARIDSPTRAVGWIDNGELPEIRPVEATVACEQAVRLKPRMGADQKIWDQSPTPASTLQVILPQRSGKYGNLACGLTERNLQRIDLLV